MPPQCEYCLQPTKTSLNFMPNFGSVCLLCYTQAGHVGQCAICHNDLKLRTARTTLSDVLICGFCARKLWPLYYYKPPTRKHPNEIKFNKYYKLFLQKKLWPEVKCKHTSSDGCVAKQPIASSAFYKV